MAKNAAFNGYVCITISKYNAVWHSACSVKGVFKFLGNVLKQSGVAFRLSPPYGRLLVFNYNFIFFMMHRFALWHVRVRLKLYHRQQLPISCVYIEMIGSLFLDNDSTSFLYFDSFGKSYFSSSCSFVQDINEKVASRFAQSHQIVGSPITSLCKQNS